MTTKELETKMTAAELVTDLQALIKEFYIGETAKSEQALTLTLSNGQAFKITVTELK